MNQIRIELLNGVKIVYKNNIYDLEKELGKQLINLFQIIVIRYDRELYREELAEMLFQSSEDPRNTLKFTVFRLRKALKSLKGFENIELIETTKKGYKLSKEYSYSFDFIEFLKIAQRIEIDEEINENVLLDIYKAPLFLTKNAPSFIKQTRIWYESCFEKAVVYVCDRLLKMGDIAECLKFCSFALQREPYSENIHFMMLSGMIEQGDYHRALRYYDVLNETFIKELGVGLSERFQDLHKRIEKDDVFSEMKLKDISKDLNLFNAKTGGFFCDYDLFKKIYEIILRYAERENTNFFLILFDVIERNRNLDNQMAISNRLKELIEMELRSSDIFTRMNTNRFLVCVKCHSKDDAHAVIERISSKFYRRVNRENYRLNYDVEKCS